MNLNAYLKSLGSLTDRERKLVIDAWIEATGVFDEGATRADELRNEVEGAGAGESPKTLRTEDIVVGDTCPRCRGAGHYFDYIGRRECLLCNGTGQVSPYSTI